MASHVQVIDATFRRTQIKVLPGTYLRSVLEESCEKLKLNPDQYTLKTDKKQLDLSLTWRLSGLPSGAKLQLVQASRSPSVVSVALLLPESEKGLRLQDKFPSDTSLWLVLRKFEEGVAGGGPAQRLNLTSRGVPSTDSGAGRLNYEQPCLNIMGRHLSSFSDLQRTLAQLGYNSGSVLLRLSFRNDGVAMEEAMAQINGYFNSFQPAPTPSTTADTTDAASDVDMSSVPDTAVDNAAAPLEGEAAQNPPEDTIMTPAPDASLSQPTQLTGGDHAHNHDHDKENLSSSPSQRPKFSIYAAPTGTTPRSALRPHNDADFAPSVEHAHAHQAVLNRQAQNKRLQSDKEIEAAAASKAQALKDIKSVMIRVRFPDQMMVDLDMSAGDTVAGLYDSVRSMMDRPERGFELRYTGSKARQETLDPASQKSLIKDLGMAGRVLVTMLWGEDVDTVARRQPALKSNLREQAKELEVKEIEPKEDAKAEEKGEGKKEEPKKKADKAGKEARLMKLMGFGKK